MGKRKNIKKSPNNGQTKAGEEDDFDEVTFSNMVKYFKKNKFDFLLLCGSLLCLIILCIATYAMYKTYLEAKARIGYGASPKGVNNTMFNLASMFYSQIDNPEIPKMLSNMEYGLTNKTLTDMIIDQNFKNSFTTKIITYLKNNGRYCVIDNARDITVRLLNIVNQILLLSPNAIVCIPQYPINLMLECSDQKDVYESLVALIDTMISKDNCKLHALEYITQAGIVPPVEKKAIVLNFLTNYTTESPIEKLNTSVCKFVSTVINDIDLWTDDIPHNLCKLQKVFPCSDFSRIDMNQYCSTDEL